MLHNVYYANREVERHAECFVFDVVPAHPDTNVEFSGTRIPAFAKCVAMVLAHHRNIPLTRSVGWDVAIGRDEAVKLMEWNASHNDIKFSEATQGPCFTDLRWDRFARERCPNATTGLVDFAASSATR